MGTLLLIFLSVLGGLNAPVANPVPPPTGATESEGVPGAGGTGAPGAPAPPAGTGRALVVGDSLAVGTKPYLGHYLPGWHGTTSATISRHAPEGPGVRVDPQTQHAWKYFRLGRITDRSEFEIVVVRGERGVGLGMQPRQLVANPGAPLQWIVPREGVLYIPIGMGMLKNAPHPMAQK